MFLNIYIHDLLQVQGRQERDEARGEARELPVESRDRTRGEDEDRGEVEGGGRTRFGRGEMMIGGVYVARTI